MRSCVVILNSSRDDEPVIALEQMDSRSRVLSIAFLEFHTSCFLVMALEQMDRRSHVSS